MSGKIRQLARIDPCWTIGDSGPHQTADGASGVSVDTARGSLDTVKQTLFSMSARFSLAAHQGQNPRHVWEAMEGFPDAVQQGLFSCLRG